jgi:creatinine amidohydrolase
MTTRITSTLLCLLLLLAPVSVRAAPSTIYMENMTWMEVRSRLQAGSTIVIVPTGGTEQNGPHLVVGKHNIVVRYTAGEIAKRLGNAMVAPVIPYSPAGRIEPAEGHMQFPGTISVSESTFGLLLEDVARSLKHHGFTLICFVGDHGGSQHAQQQVADRLSREWQSDKVRVINVSNYYSGNGQQKWAQSVGIKTPNIDAHGGIADTSELMAVDGQGVRDSLRGPHSDNDYKTSGAMGDSTEASVNYGRRT